MEHRIVTGWESQEGTTNHRDVLVCACGAIFRDGRTSAQSNATAHIQEEWEILERNAESERMATEIRGEMGRTR
jgi:hypothetical protein